MNQFRTESFHTYNSPHPLPETVEQEPEIDLMVFVFFLLRVSLQEDRETVSIYSFF